MAKWLIDLEEFSQWCLNEDLKNKQWIHDKISWNGSKSIISVVLNY